MIEFDMSYGPEPQHKYDLSQGSSGVLLVIVHGGGWVGGDKRASNLNNGDCIEWVAARYGLNVATINYTLATKDHPTAPITIDNPATGRPTHNVQYASRFIADRIGVERVILLGTSAGANIAALTRIFYPDMAEGFIGFYGAYSLSERGEFSAAVQGMIDIYTGEERDAVYGASPDSDAMPDRALLYHGSLDRDVSPMQTMRFALEGGHEYHIVDGEKHAFRVFGTEDDPAPWMERIVRYCYEG